MPIIAGGRSMIYSRTVYCREIISCSDLTFSDVHATIPYPLSDAANPVLNTVNKTIVGAINEVLGAVVAEDLWDRAAGVLYTHNANDEVRVDAIMWCTDGGLSAGFKANALSWGHDAAGHTSWIQSAAVVGTELGLNLQGGAVRVGGLLYTDAGINSAGNITMAVNTFIGGGGNYLAITFRNFFQTNNVPTVELGSSSNCIIFCEKGDRTVDFGTPIYTDPTPRVQSGDATKPDQFVAKQHNRANAKEIIGTGSQVFEHLAPIELADDASFLLPDATAGKCDFIVEDSEEDGGFTWKSDGTVNLRDVSTNVVNTDTDTQFCIFNTGTQVEVRNRLGAAKKVLFDYNYWTP